MAELPPPSSRVCTRVIDGVLYKRALTPYAFDLRVHELGNGHVEATALPRHAWSEVDNLSECALSDYQACLDTPPSPTPLEALKSAEMNRDRATRRARTCVRRLAKFKALTVLLTLTYRENMTDRSRMARDFDVFIKRVRRVLVGFEYICVFETQKRGAWHAHIAVRKIQSHYMHKGALVQSYALLRSMWRGVVGADNGNVDVSRNKRVNRSAAKLASYLSKYIGKTFDQAEKHVNSYSASGRALPPAVLERFDTTNLADAMSALVDLIRFDSEQPCEFHQAFIGGGGYFVCLSPRDRGR